MLDTFIKTYSHRSFKHVTMVRHMGKVIAFALDRDRRIYYAALDLDNQEIKSALDVNFWPANPRELIFPNEIAETGVGVADQTLLPEVKKGSRTPGPPNLRVRDDEKDFFLSTTARFTAEAPFQALSDGRFVYLFRQAVEAQHPDNLNKRNAEGNEVKDAEGNPVPVVDATLLVDRFVFAGAELRTKMEVRYQRSRSKTRPQSRKDSLGAKDLEEKPFFEPTQELRFVRGLAQGRFTALLLPTQVANVERWQIFAHNPKTGAIDAYNIERAPDGLFNTRGTLAPESLQRAESALKFFNTDDHVAFTTGVKAGKTFTQEAWIFPTAESSGAAPLGLGLIHSQNTHEAAPAIWIYQGKAVRAGFGDGQKWYEFVTGPILRLQEWNHLAVVFDGAFYRVYVNGEERHRTQQVEAYENGQHQETPALLKDLQPADRAIKFFGAPGNSFQGVIDEIRLWQRPRSQAELKSDLHQRLTGLEPGLAGYWRFDEASGDTVYDQTDGAAHGHINGGEWVTSGAPLGENSGLQRSSFRIAGRNIGSGLTALLYHHQEESSRDAKQRKPLKRSARVMLALAAPPENGNPEIAVLDFGVSAEGRLAQAPDHLSLPVIHAPGTDGVTVDERLNLMSTLEARLNELHQGVVNLTNDIAASNQAEDLLLAVMQNRDPGSAITNRDLEYLNAKVQAVRAARERLGQKITDENKLIREASSARIQLFEHSGYRGRTLSYGKGFVGYTELNRHGFNDLISSVTVPASLQVTVYEHAAGGGKSLTLTENTAFVGKSWNDIISSMTIEENAGFAAKKAAAAAARQQAQNAVNDTLAVLATERDDLKTSRQAKERERLAKEQEITGKQTELQTHRAKLEEGLSVAMPLVHTDPFGLSLTAGVLGFAWTNDAPLLFDSATGRIALYFRGADDQFFVVYYNTLTQRAQYTLVDERGNRTVVCSCRTTEPEMDSVRLKISGASAAATCIVTITGPNMEETWENVPRSPERFAKVLNGQAGARAFAGMGLLEVEAGNAKRLQFANGSRRLLEAGSTLIAGNLKLRVRAQAASGALEILVEGTVTNPPQEALPFFFLDYDYAAHAHTTKVPGDLRNGSLLLLACSFTNTGRVQVDQEIASGSTISCQWTAAMPGHTLSFDGQNSFVHLAETTPENLKKFAAPRNLTLEAWARPNQMENLGRLVQHQSPASSYALGLKRQTLLSALRLRGDKDYVLIPHRSHLNFTGAITIEAWIKPQKFDGLRNIVAHGHHSNPAGEIYLRIRDDHYEIGSWNGADHKAFFPVPTADKTGNEWVHLAGVYDGAAWLLYRNGEEVQSTEDATGAVQAEADWAIGGRGLATPERLFDGEIDEVRIWKRGRTRDAIRSDMNRRLSGNETDLVGYWHFDFGVARDYSRYENHGAVQGRPERVASSLPGYSAFAGVNERFVQEKEIFAGGSWTHLAAVFHQSYALQFDGGAAYLDCGNDATLDLNGDMTLEVFLELRGNAPCGILSKGKIDDGTEQDVPYSLHLDGEGRIVFAFEDVGHGNHQFKSNAGAVVPGHFNRIALTRKRQVVTTEEKNSSGRVTGVKVEQWYDFKFYNKTGEVGSGKYEIKESSGAQQGPEIGSSNAPLEIGRAFLENFREARCQGVISEVRIWSAVRDAASLGVDIKGHEQGLVSWWRFEENEGNIAFDSKSSNHARFKGNIAWIKNPEANASQLLLYRDGEPVSTLNKTENDFGAAEPQFALGALANHNRQHFFQGEMEEVRIWKIARKQEQVQDNLFRRLAGEKEDLIAYYTFDAEKSGKVSDHSFASNDLAIVNAAFVFSTAPIGEDTPQVRSALAGIRTPFHGLLHGRVAVQEYGDMQYDVDGNLIGVLKRCYAFIKDNHWHLITGFKVGNLVTEWIGQVQFAPELKGFIEGPPPVPSENLTFFDYVLKEFTDYDAASTVEIAEARRTMYTYSAQRDTGADLSVEAKLGGVIGLKTEAGFGLLSETTDVENVFGVHMTFENSWSWLDDAQTGAGITTTKTSKLELRGIVENVDDVAYPYPKAGRRYVPDNVGFALVQSETADVFALRLAHNNALVALRMQPNPDIPKDWNIISFPINPRYTKQGTLDGKVGLDPDSDYPNAMNYSPDSSYFKPIEAYALKNRIRREEEALRAFYEQFTAGEKGRRFSATHFSEGDLGAGALLPNLPKIQKRNLANTYVWTSDGGLFAETEETLDILQETTGGAYAFKGMAGVYTDLTLKVLGAGIKFELDAMLGGHLNLTVTKSRASETAFALNLDLGGVERNIYFRTPEGEIVLDYSDPRNPRPKRWPGKVNSYRFMTFYLEPKTDHFDVFFSKVVDPIWLEQSDNPNAVALREARQIKEKPACWRVFHRITFVSRILPEFAEAAPPLEKTLRELDLESNFELIKLLEPFVANKLANFSEFKHAIHDTLKTYHPELQPHSEAIIQFMSLYFGITDEAALRLGEGAVDDSLLGEEAPSLPVVDAGPEALLVARNASIELQGALRNSPAPLEDLLITWQKISGPGEVIFSDPHTLITTATFGASGLHKLRLSVNDGLLVFSDDIEIAVNGEPEIFAGSDLEILPLETALLHGELWETGLGDPQRGNVSIKWAKVDGPGDVSFGNTESLQTTAAFSRSGVYLLRLTADNGSFAASDEVAVSVAARVSRNLQALYVFEEGAGPAVWDVSGAGAPLHLRLPADGKTVWIHNGLAVHEPALIQTETAAAKIIYAAKATDELTLEVWLKPAAAEQTGLARILTLSGGPAARNFTLGQRGKSFHAAIRTTATNENASDKALAAAEAATGALTHVVCTRAASGEMRIFINGHEAAQRLLEGSFANWNENHRLLLGNEANANGVLDRAWSGEFHLAAIYNRALTATDVKQNFEFGANTNLAPLVEAGPDQIIKLPETAQLQGRLTDDRLAPDHIQTKWTQASGPLTVIFENSEALATTATFNAGGRYLLRLTASDGDLSNSDELAVIVNQAPVIDAGATQWLEFPASAQLHGVIASDGLGDASLPKNISHEWTQLEGPGTATFADARALGTPVSFSEYGKYTLQLSASNGFLPPATAAVTIFVNQKPAIHARAEAIVDLPGVAHLMGEEIALGLADPNGAVIRTWTKSSGPGDVTFDDAHALQTSAHFSRSGVYVLKLKVEIKAQHLILADEAEVRIIANRPPVVDAGPDQAVELPGHAELEGTVSDDGMPNPPGAVAVHWQKRSGPGQVHFGNAGSTYTSARFSKAGVYVLQLIAKDHEQAGPVSADVKITVTGAPRVVEGLQALYDFSESVGEVVHDVSDIGAPLDLVLENRSNKSEPVTWLNPGLRLNAAVILKAPDSSALINALRATHEITIEAWIKRAGKIAAGKSPGRIVTLSSSATRRNFTLGQLPEELFEMRLRTSNTNQNGTRLQGSNENIAQTVPAVDALCHLVYTRDAGGNVRFYLNGEDANAASRPHIGGDFTSWEWSEQFALGNELSGDYPWLGEYYLVALYNRALSAEEVQQNFGVGMI